MKQVVLFLSFVLLILSQMACDEVACTTPNSTQLAIKYYTENGQNLDLMKRFPKTGIKIYYKENGIFKTTPNSNKALIKYQQSDTTITLILETSDIYENSFSEMLLELNENEKDTIKCGYYFFNGDRKCSAYTALIDVWYNGDKLKGGEYTPLFFEIEK